MRVRQNTSVAPAKRDDLAVVLTAKRLVDLRGGRPAAHLAAVLAAGFVCVTTLFASSGEVGADDREAGGAPRAGRRRAEGAPKSDDAGPAQLGPRFEYERELDLARFANGRLRLVTVQPRTGLAFDGAGALPVTIQGEFYDARAALPRTPVPRESVVNAMFWHLGSRIRDGHPFDLSPSDDGSAWVGERVARLPSGTGSDDASISAIAVQPDAAHSLQVEIRQTPGGLAHCLIAEQRVGARVAEGAPAIMVTEHVYAYASGANESRTTRVLRVHPSCEGRDALVAEHHVGRAIRAAGPMRITRSAHVVLEVRRDGFSVRSLPGGFDDLRGTADDVLTGGDSATDSTSTGPHSDEIVWESPWQMYDNRSRGIRAFPLLVIARPLWTLAGRWDGSSLLLNESLFRGRRTSRIDDVTARWTPGMDGNRADVVEVGGFWRFDAAGNLVIVSPLACATGADVARYFERRLAACGSDRELLIQLQHEIDVIEHFTHAFPGPSDWASQPAHPPRNLVPTVAALRARLGG